MTTATPIEVKKIAYRQSAKDGLVITFSIHPDDMPSALAAAPIGARFMAALVEIGDDELPVVKKEEAEKERRAWATLTPTVQAGIRCAEPVFQAYVREKRKFNEEEDGELNAARFVRRQCNINTRAALATNEPAATVWASIDSDFLGWKHSESM